MSPRTFSNARNPKTFVTPTKFHDDGSSTITIRPRVCAFPHYLFQISSFRLSLTIELRHLVIALGSARNYAWAYFSAPLISSTVYPGQISSTAINVNFGESDPEQGRFDHYILTFSGNNKNITKKLEINDE